MEVAELVMIDRDQPLLRQAFHLHAVMHDVAQTLKFRTFCQFFLGFFDGSGHTEAEATAIIYLYLKHRLISGVKEVKGVKRAKSVKAGCVVDGTW